MLEKFQEEQFISKARRRATLVLIHQAVEGKSNQQRFIGRSKSQETTGNPSKPSSNNQSSKQLTSYRSRKDSDNTQQQQSEVEQRFN